MAEKREMMPCQDRLRIFQLAGAASPYMAVIAGVFFLRNAFAAVLFYHAVLVVCILRLNGTTAFVFHWLS